MSKFVQEFKQFAMKGNVVDMAVGIIIGGAFGKIVSSLVSDLLMPLVGALAGGVNFTDWKWTIVGVTLNYGNFIQVLIDFIII
ncbi:MAG TPA: large conductance mechanosensitive channel protein MscL, partial [Bacteroidales bacterium]|nr:large conductance mechanosensitive channel protein MscL [Bacteroidales bacterium]